MIEWREPVTPQLVAFWHWWRGELAALLPLSLRTLFSQWNDLLILTDNGAAFELTYITRDGTHDLGTFDVGQLEEEMAAPLRSKYPQIATSEIVVRFPAERGLRKVFRLPAAAENNLRAVVAYEMDRQTPFTTEQVYYDVEVLKKLAESRQIQIELVLMLRPQLDAAWQLFSNGWLKPNIIDLASPDAEQANELPSHNLLPLALRTKRKNFAGIVNILLSILLVILLLVLMLLPLYANMQQVDQLEQAVSVASKQVAVVQSLKNQVIQQREEMNFLQHKVEAMPQLVEVFSSLSQLVPDDSWLTSLEFKQGRIVIQGQSSGAAQLMASIESAPLFHQTAFESQVTTDRKTKKEKFRISTHLVNQTKSEPADGPEQP